MLTILAIILACGAGTAQTVNASTAKDAKPAGMQVYYASHSLMWDMPPVLTELTQTYGIKDHKVVNIDMLGVSFTRQFWNRPDAQNPAKKALIDGKLNAFVMSPIGMPDEAIESFVKLGLEHNPNMKFFVQISWPGLGLLDNNDMEGSMGGGGMMGGSRGPGAPSGTPAPPQTAAAPGGRGGGMMGGMMGGGQNYNKTPEEIAKINVKNNKSAEEQAKKINEAVGKKVLYLIPTAQAHNALRVMIYNKEMPGMTDQGEVFRDFIGHPTDPVIALNAYLHFAVMYGVSPVGLPIPTILKNSRKPEYREEKFNLALQELAWKIVSNYPPSGVKAPGKN